MLELKTLDSPRSPSPPCERFGAANAKSGGELEDECGSVIVDANV